MGQLSWPWVLLWVSVRLKPKAAPKAKTAAPSKADPEASPKAKAAVPPEADTEPEPKAASVPDPTPAPEPAPKPELPQPRRSVAFIGSECYPFVKTGGLGDVMYALPKALA
ncbi:MAG TPA: glycogen/starch synthase, partial [Atopobiaceae bacterium]|nr:glycogen/starch synthase [Atopobiaceae bacterium]